MRSPTSRHFSSTCRPAARSRSTDWMPDEYRAKLIKFIEMHGNSELMGVLPEREWILRAPTLQRKLALTAKVQDEVGHAQLIYRVVEDLGKPREQCLADLVAGKTKFHNVFHYPTRTWGDVGVIAWLVDAAAIISQKALLKCSYAPYARIMKKICWEESFHILHGRDVILAMVTGHRGAARARAGGAQPLVGAADAVPRQPDPGRGRPDVSAGGSSRRATRRRGSSSSTATSRRSGSSASRCPTRSCASATTACGSTREPDWDELQARRHRPRPADGGAARVRRRFLEQEEWVRDVVLARGGVIFEVFRQERQGPAVRARGLGRGAGRGASPRRTRGSSTAAAASRWRCGSCRARRCTRSTTGRTSSTSSTAASTATRSRRG